MPSLNQLRPLIVLGTRPEAIKLAPVLWQCQQRPDRVEPIVCVTGQHRDMLTPLLEYFRIVPDHQLDLMTTNQTLATLTARCLEGIDAIVASRRPHCIVAQGDTTTVLAAAMIAFYRKLPLVHVEAGLRTGNLQAPWPEEFNRRVADMVTALYCAPTQGAADVLLNEGAPPEAVRVTGNTVIDTLLDTVRRQQTGPHPWQEKYEFLANRRVVLITGHRRESFGEGFENICRAIAALADRFPDELFVYPVHLNPNVQEPVHRLLAGRGNVRLLGPVGYPEFVWLMGRAALVLTDSGGVQEEAPALSKPVLVMRDVTERPEAVAAGAAMLVGTSVEAIVAGVSSLLLDRARYAACQVGHSPYGDGSAAGRIVDWMLEQPWQR
jgi:UDP-N-acetylglucosamine 2-epimerase (non-hydrolysing)